jgi:exosortase C (VPDSG-CTERM-specific)
VPGFVPSVAGAQQRRIVFAAVWLIALTLLFSGALTKLVLHVAQSDLHSYALLVPFVTAYLLYLKPPHTTRFRTSSGAAALLLGLGILMLAAQAVLGTRISTNDSVGLTAAAYLSLAAAGVFLFLGSDWVAGAAFPIAFALFVIPLPDAVVNGLEKTSVLASAEVAAWMFEATGTPLLRDGVIFALPGIVIQVAQECSGIRSSWVLFITSVVASHLFLKGRWNRLVLIAFIFPLAIVRNAFRILVIGLLCVHVGPHMIDSPIHHQGGPIFFALSLVPLFVVMFLLHRREQTVKANH